MYYVIEVKECSECNGSGIVYDPVCRTCRHSFTHQDLSDMAWSADNLPCGHSIRKLREERECFACNGEGKVERRVPLRDALRELRSDEVVHAEVEAMRQRLENLEQAARDVVNRYENLEEGLIYIEADEDWPPRELEIAVKVLREALG